MKQILVITNIFSLIAVSYLLFFKNCSKSGYFLSADVYNSFDYKIELETELENERAAYDKVLDSLEKDLKTTILFMQKSTPTQDDMIALERKQNGYIDYRNYVETEYSTKAEQSYTQIWDRINMYVKEYGESNGYQYIFGANGNGSIMYADASDDITEDVISYINMRYDGE